MSASLLHAWSRTVAAAPATRALVDAASGRIWSRRELDTLAAAWHTAHGPDAAGQTVVFAESNGPGWLEVFLGLLKSGAVIVALDPGEPPAAQRTIATAIGATRLWSGGRLESLAPRRRAPRDGRRLIKLTSGSTGTPRALAFTDAQMLADGRQICAAMRVRATDLNLGLIPWGHSYGLGNLVLPLLMQGTALLSGVAPLPHAIAAAAARWRPTVFPAVPAVLGALVASEVGRAQLASLRTVISAGAPLPAAVAVAFQKKFGRTIHGFYGSSETGGICYDPTGAATLAGRSVAPPLPEVRRHFRRGGRFAVESPAVFTLGRRRQAARGHLMADVARLDERGELVLLGRAGRSVKIAGRRLNLVEVEQALRRLPGVRDAWVSPHPARPDMLAAVVASTRPAAELLAALRGQLASWKLPRKWILLPEFPLTARGKTDVRQLRASLRGGPATRGTE
jgi:acyl-CoA synthetase (AMP-forming)/AMP-acid ligase II